MTEVIVTGVQRLRQVGALLKATGNGEMRRLLLRRLRETGQPIIADLCTEAHDTFGDAGGLAQEIAGGKFTVRSRLTGRGVGVRIVSVNRRDIAALDAGRLRHPVFGHRTWVTQPIRPGWFTKTITGDAPLAAAKIQQAANDVAALVEGGL